MRVTRVQAEENRQTVINVASRLFRERGFDGIGLKDVMEGAGLTQGAFYKQFSSKEDLITQASARALETTTRKCLAAIANNPDDPLGAVTAYYLGKKHRDDLLDGCPIVALGSDAVRQGAGVKASFEAGINAHLNVLQSSIFAAGDKRPDNKAMAIFSMMVGALLLSRVVNDPDLAQAFLDTAVEQVRKLASS
jgi:TetR/AcrR family transcriptional regulator, transcriptional repressor for nem operon